MKILAIRGYSSSSYSKEVITLKDQIITVTMVPIGKPVLVRKKFKQILSKYNPENYDYIYLVSMSSCMTSLLDKDLLKKVCLITPFFLHFRPVRMLSASAPKDFFGCYILMLLNGKMGIFDNSIRVKLAEFDNVTDNKFFQNKFNNTEIIKGVGHCLGENGVLEVIKEDLGFLLSQG